MKAPLVLLFSLLFALSSMSQNVEFKKKNFSDQAGFDEATKNLQKGDEIFIQGKKWQYPNALEFFMKAQAFNPNNAKLNFKIGVCYLNSSDKPKSLPFFQKAFELDPKVDPKINYALAQAYHFSFDWDNAIRQYNIYLLELSKLEEGKMKINPYVTLTNKKIEECQTGKLLVSSPVDVEITNLGSTINSLFNDYAPLLSPDENQLTFTSRRAGSTGGEIDQNQQEYYEDIYSSKKTGDTWSEPVKLGEIINTPSHEATCGISTDGKTMFIYKGLSNNGDIFISTLENDQWTAPKSLPPVINTQYRETSASLTADGKTLYFISSRPDKSYGERDIFISTLDQNNNWTEPINAGNAVNTEWDEEGVYIQPDGKTLYFSSQGHNSMGGFDLFRSVKQEDGTWSKPENLGYPINTPDDDLYAMVFGTPPYVHGYYSTIKQNGFGEKDIYFFNIKKPEEKTVAVNDTASLNDSLIANNHVEPSSLFVNVDSSQTTVNNNTKIKPTVTTDNPPDKDPKNDPSLNKEKTTTSGNEGLVFHVQVGASHKPMPHAELHARYPGNMKVSQVYHDGWYKYLIGEYKLYSDAKNIRNTCGTQDAWVVVYRDGIRVPISEVIQSISLLPENQLLLSWLQ
jgi:tetratricopeptide (TPR) repeat protein